MASVLALLLGAMGCADAADGLTGPDWRRVMPDMGDWHEIDVNSLVPHEGGWAAWTKSPSREVDMPEGMALAPGGSVRVRMHVECGQHSVAVRFLEARFLAADGQLVQATTFGDPDTDGFPSPGAVSYKQNAIPMICAAAAARCEGDALEWPLPTDDPRFVPTCKAF
ncbi:hypothetical protein EER27_14645 [Lysobacter psychrotolerans]|uniref:Uncharacterized protein n=2 Tax=Montanilutibacter psychrotolerans TaxID=1327343 RepID=A0A3M8SNX4_9GAMM|nr:hypothetical protein EER27_14645 [Lysobacter psychrotolerans]